MKIMSRDFTRTEKILIMVLVLILLALVYYQFVEKTVRQSITNAQSEAGMLETELAAAQASGVAPMQFGIMGQLLCPYGHHKHLAIFPAVQIFLQLHDARPVAHRIGAH